MKPGQEIKVSLMKFCYTQRNCLAIGSASLNHLFYLVATKLSKPHFLLLNLLASSMLLLSDFQVVYTSRLWYPYHSSCHFLPSLLRLVRSNKLTPKKPGSHKCNTSMVNSCVPIFLYRHRARARDCVYVIALASILANQ